MRGWAGARAAALLLALACWVAPADAAPRIGVATMQPGEVFFERFGHDAIVVDDPAVGEPISYNFGFFDVDEDGFLGRFIRGDMRYRLVALPFADDLVHYRETGRGVSIQWLALTDAEAEGLAQRLATNARPENARYRYQYFTDNCATRVRDAIDTTLGGALRPQFEVRSAGNTYRSEAVRLASPAPWMWLGFDIGLGPSADRPNSLWQDAFVPMRLADGLRRARRPDGQPLVAAEQVILPHRTAPEPVARARATGGWLAAGLLLSALIGVLAARTPRLLAATAAVFWTLSVVVGGLMLFIWGFTAHDFGWGNRNLLLFNPIALLALPGAWRLLRGRAPGPVFIATLLALAACAVLALLLDWLPGAGQRNGHWIALLLPVHLALAWSFARPRQQRAAVG